MAHEIDLVPEDYRAWLRLLAWSRRLVLGCAALLVGIGVARVALALELRSEAAELERVEAAAAEARAEQERMEKLRDEKARLTRELAILEGLRGGVAAERMFVAVDRALAPEIRFTDWTFRRDGSLVDAEERTVETGYFIVVPAEGSRGKPRAWRLDTHMELRGRAPDHSSLARFVGRLMDQPEIADVRILETSARQYTKGQAVQFELAVVVKGEAS